MFIDPRAVLMLVVLVGVTGLVLKSLMMTWHRISRERRSGDVFGEMEERLRKVEAATSSLLVDVSGMREKQRFMARLQAGADSRDNAASIHRHSDSQASPLDTQNIPIVRRG